MSKFHSTVSRREFMKYVGLAGVGLGAATAASPAFHDLDEIMASPKAAETLPWWIKGREYLNPTTEVDWDVVKRYDGTMYPMIPGYAQGSPSNMASQMSPERLAKMQSDSTNWMQDCLTKNNIPGFTRRDWAFSRSATDVIQRMSYRNGHNFAAFMGDEAMMNEVPSLPDVGFPKWDGNEDENGSMMRTLTRYFGGHRVRFLAIDDKTRKLVNTGDYRDPQRPFVFEDTPVPYEGTDRKAIPLSGTYAIVFSYIGCWDTAARPDTYIYRGGALKQCLTGDSISLYLQRFLKALGYWGVTSDDFTGMVSHPAVGVMSGHGELGRMQQCVCPDTWVRATRMIITNLPLPVSNPIDAGIARFCETACSKCATLCPSQAISHGNPSWDPCSDPENPYLKPNEFFVPGKKSWSLNHIRCEEYMTSRDFTLCGVCYSNCVFNKLHDSNVHDLVKPVISNTSLFNGFFYNMDKAFGYGQVPEDQIEDFWNLGNTMAEAGLGKSKSTLPGLGWF